MRDEEELDEQLSTLVRRFRELGRVVATEPEGSAEWMRAAGQAELARLFAMTLGWVKGAVETDLFESFLRDSIGA